MCLCAPARVSGGSGEGGTRCKEIHQGTTEVVQIEGHDDSKKRKDISVVETEIDTLWDQLDLGFFLSEEEEDRSILVLDGPVRGKAMN